MEGIEPSVDGVQQRTGKRHAEMGLEQFRRVGRKRCDRVAETKAAPHESRSEAAHARKRLGPGSADLAMHDGGGSGKALTARSRNANGDNGTKLASFLSSPVS